MIEKRKCFGTTEYKAINQICKCCRDYIECGKVKRKKHSGMTKRVIKDYKYYRM